MSRGFEGSFLGKQDQLDDSTRLECRICWYLYDPAEGDPLAQVAPGTPFSRLPVDWRCPQCDAGRMAFLVAD